jgi:anti-sigma factor RsiW
VLASHIRSLLPGHLTDVATTSRHTVKPWFSGRLDYSPPVYDLAAQGFPLVGGRPVAALVYRHEQHMINLFVWPVARGGASELSRLGYHCLHWNANGLEYWLVSELNSGTLRDFKRAHK